MLFKNVSIVSLAYVDAPHVITSSSIEERLSPTLEKLKMRPNIIEALTGIKERRLWDPGVQPSEAATLAGEKAIQDSGIDRSKIGVIINTSVCKDYIEPSVACFVHRNLNLNPDCLNFDVGNACLAFLNAMQIIGNMIEQGQTEYGLIVDGEGSRFIIDKTVERLLLPDCDEKIFRDNFAALTLGSGAVAMVLGKSGENPKGHKVTGSVSLAATEHNQLCLGQPDHMVTDASTLLVSGIKLAAQTYEKAKNELGWKDNNPDELVLHQVSSNHTSKLAESLNLNLEKVYKIFPEFGNIGPASLPITLAKTVGAGRVSEGNRVALMGIGSGLNCSMMEVIW